VTGFKDEEQKNNKKKKKEPNKTGLNCGSKGKK
jgi:hypothetical protein